jgi:hypothetical protein
MSNFLTTRSAARGFGCFAEAACASETIGATSRSTVSSLVMGTAAFTGLSRVRTHTTCWRATRLTRPTAG